MPVEGPPVNPVEPAPLRDVLDRRTDLQRRIQQLHDCRSLPHTTASAA
jgi:hypothetical protein